MQNTLSELDKVQAALPQVRGLEASDTEMDDLADKATKGFDDLMDLGMNVDSRWASDIFGVASTMLGHAITAKTAKLNKKLKMVDLQLKKANLDQKVISNNEDIATGTGVVLDRNALLDRLLNKDKEEK
jgi:phage gp29-like protein